MLTITSNEQANSLVKNGVLYVDDDIEIAFDGFRIDADIKCRNIYSKERPRDIKAKNINALDIIAKNINALDIIAKNIETRDINARGIIAGAINAGNINAWLINADDIEAANINAISIVYYKICVAYYNITCASIKGRKENARHFCHRGKVTIKGEK